MVYDEILNSLSLEDVPEEDPDEETKEEVPEETEKADGDDEEEV